MIAESKVSYAPVTKMVNGEEKTSFIKMGVRIDMVNGNWWFYKFRNLADCSDGEIRTVAAANKWVKEGPNNEYTLFESNSWTKHIPGKPKRYKSLSVVHDGTGGLEMEKDKVTRYQNTDKLAEKITPHLMEALAQAVMDAIAEDAAKRAA